MLLRTRSVMWFAILRMLDTLSSSGSFVHARCVCHLERWLKVSAQISVYFDWDPKAGYPHNLSAYPGLTVLSKSSYIYADKSLWHIRKERLLEMSNFRFDFEPFSKRYKENCYCSYYHNIYESYNGYGIIIYTDTAYNNIFIKTWQKIRQK